MWPRLLGPAPLAPFAVAATAGIVTDRFLGAPTEVWLLVALAGAAAWVALVRRGPVAIVGLWVCAAGLAGARHHAQRHDFPVDDIAAVAGPEARVVRVRGVLDDEPTVRRSTHSDPLTARPRPDSTTAMMSVTAIDVSGVWVPASGRVRMSVEGAFSAVHVGDTVDVTGVLSRPTPPLNPGEADRAAALLNARIRAELRVRGTTDAVVRLDPGPWGVGRGLATARRWFRQAIQTHIPDREAAVAAALLVGDTSAMSQDEWDAYVRTGVVHVLAISGQHLVILGAALWFVLRALRVSRRRTAVVVAAVLIGYALLTGGRPSAMRAAVMATAVCGAVLARAQALPGNTFALAWLVVVGLDPNDLFTPGFQLSFLCVAVLIWGIPVWLRRHEPTPLEVLIDESRSGFERSVRAALRAVGRMYFITLALGIATAPLLMYWQNLAAPVGVLIGPPAIVLTTVALITGFVLILVAPLGAVAAPLGWVVDLSLVACDWLVRRAEWLPGGCWYTGGVPLWWVVGFYAIGVAWLTFGSARRFGLALATWTVVGLVVVAGRPNPDEFRLTFLAVDHGGCAVMEAPDGRVILYDVGSTAGPDVTRRIVAPYLWSRGIRRVDEVFVSHADLDHFNGLPALLDRFAVGQITYTPTFADKPTAGVRAAIAAIEQRGTRVRAATTGDRFTAGEVELTVLHPPRDGPEGVENVRSLVLLVRHLGHSFLLTGDLEGAGQDRVVSGPAPAIDVLMTPHHGNPNVEPLADWARPRLAVSCQGRGDAGKAEAVYRRRGIPYLSTWPDGAITFRSHSTGLTVETFATGRRDVVRGGSGP
ncbi:MAG TPA: ComEC/Rec2 family competence protein [Gemmataceae bacterium]|nr:ComEC/Rec2 family competence protein [Gemmataceae bacterium]